MNSGENMDNTENDPEVGAVFKLIALQRKELWEEPIEGSKDFATKIAGRAEEIFVKEGEVAPAAFFYMKEADAIVLMPLELGGESSKNMVRSVILATASKIGADAIGLISECWSASVSGEEDAKSGPPAAEREDREECIMTTVSWHYGEDDKGEANIERLQLMTKIVRNGENVSLFRNDIEMETVRPEGRFVF